MINDGITIENLIRDDSTVFVYGRQENINSLIEEIDRKLKGKLNYEISHKIETDIKKIPFNLLGSDIVICTESDTGPIVVGNRWGMQAIRLIAGYI